MRKIFIAASVLIILGIAYWLISPLFIERKVDESIEDLLVSDRPVLAPLNLELPAVSILQIAQGKFIGLAGHNAEGTATLVKAGEKYFVRFEDDFRVTNGPDLFVYFGKDGKYAAEARLDGLKGNVGSQNYEVPAGINPLDYNEVWVWCRAFSVAFGKAELK